MENIDFNEWEIDKSKSSEDVIVLKKIKKEKALTWDEIQQDNSNKNVMQYYNDSDGSVVPISASSIPKNYSYRSIPSERIAEKISALCQMYVIAEYYNRVYANSWIPDWGNKLQDKWYARWDNSINCLLISNVIVWSNVIPYFATEDLAQMAYKNNKEIFETALKP